MLAFIFPGQGSQHPGMGRDLFDRIPQFIAIEREVDDLLGFSLRQMCLEDPGHQLALTQYTQPCLFAVNTLHYYAAQEKHGTPDIVAGHSLGEYNALWAAGAFDFITGLKLVRKRGDLMGKVQGGGMAAVLGPSVTQIENILCQERLSLHIANYNSPLQTIVSGPMEDLDRAAPIFDRAGAMFRKLPVSGAFHSPCMEQAAQCFAEYLRGFSFGELRMPVACNVNGAAYPSQGSDTSIRELLVRQLTEPVQWTQCILYLKAYTGGSRPVEIGPGNVLDKLTRQIYQARV